MAAYPAPGKRRSFGIVVLLGIITFGIYWLVWSWKSHGEVFRAFHQEAEGRKRGTLWFVLGIVLSGPFMLVYDWIWVGNVQAARRRLGLPGGITPGVFLVLQLVSNVGILVIWIWLRIVLATAPAPAPGSTELPEGFWAPLITLVVVALVGIVLSLIAFGRLQSDMNAIWQRAPMGIPPPHMPGYPPPAAWPPASGAAAWPPPGQAPAAWPAQPSPLPPKVGTPVAPASGPTGLAAGAAQPRARRVKCPRCGTPVVVPPGQRPACPSCGFGNPSA